jgi:hypothetical protein
VIAVQRALENRIVAQKLRDYGVSPDEVQIKLASMSDQDVHTLASATKGLPAGGVTPLGALIGVAILVLLVIVIIKLLNKDIVVNDRRVRAGRPAAARGAGRRDRPTARSAGAADPRQPGAVRAGGARDGDALLGRRFRRDPRGPTRLRPRLRGSLVTDLAAAARRAGFEATVAQLEPDCW